MEFLVLASDKKDIVPVSVIAQYSAETKSNGFVKVSETLHTTRLNRFLTRDVFIPLGHTNFPIACFGAVAAFAAAG